MYDIEELKVEIKGRLSDKRWRHSLYVAELSVEIAAKNGVDVRKAEIAGLLHDIAKELSNETLLRMVEEHSMKISRYDRDHPHALHGIVGAYIAERDFGVTDKEILGAIAYHLGRPGMTPLEKTIFLADHIDKVRRLGNDYKSFIAEKSMDKAILKMLLEVQTYMVERDLQNDERTSQTFDYMLEMAMREREAAGSETPQKDMMESDITDELFDKALDVYKAHGLDLKSVKNIRDLGGYMAADGKHVRRFRLIRSASLASLNQEDAEKLRELGINCIIDLRKEKEQLKNPDVNVQGFRYESCKLAAINVSEYQHRIHEQYLVSDNEEERAWLAAEYVRASDMDMEEMYKRILFDAPSIKELKRVYDILLDDDCTGALFHCTSGKDRTGIVSILLLMIFGVDDDDIFLDYYASLFTTYAFSETLVDSLMCCGYGNELASKSRYINGLGTNMVENIKEWIQNRYGSVSYYLSNVLELDDKKIQELKGKFLC